MKIIKWLDDNLEESILVLFLVVITLVISMQMVFRVFGNALTWTEEFARFVFIWSGFLSISYCFKKRISIKIEQFADMLPVRVNAAVKLLEKAVLLVFYFFMIQYAHDYFVRAIDSGQLSPAMQIPMYTIQVAPLVGFVLSVIRLIQGVFEKSYMLVFGIKDDKKPEVNTNM